jgi:hypothetical protein
LKKVWFVLLGALFIFLPGRASASELQFEGMGAHNIVTIAGDSGIVGSYYAGEINWIWSDPVPGGFEKNLYTYCVDILHELEDPQQVQISDTNDPLMVTHADDGGAKAAWLLNTYASGIHDSGDGIQAAALQTAIWEAISDNDHNLDNGYFKLLTTNTYTSTAIAQAIHDQANSYLNALFYDGGYHTSTATWLDATTATGGGQDQIMTPEPSSLALLGIAGLFARRRKKTLV